MSYKKIKMFLIDKKKNSKLKEKKEEINFKIDPKHVKIILKFTLWFFLILLFVLTIARITVIGQGIYDIFRLLFGWTQYFIFLGIIFLVIWKKTILKKKFKRKTEFTKEKFFKIFWTLISIYWTLGLISAIVLISMQNKSWHEYSSYGLDKIIPKFFNEWNNSSIYEYKLKNVKDFFDWHKIFADKFDGGGLIGLIFASLSCYLQIIGALILILINWFFLYSYIKHNSFLYYFVGYERKKKIKWENLNEKDNYQMKTNIMDEINDQDITIELDVARKLHAQENESENLIKKKITTKQKEFLQNKKEEEIQFVELEINSTKNKTTKEIDFFKNENIDIKNEEWKKFDKKTINKKNNYETPTTDLFEESFVQNKEKNKLNQEIIEENINKINELFKQYQVKAKIKNVHLGPRVTRYVVNLEQGTKVQKILELEPDLKFSLATKQVRLEAPIPGQSAVGIEIPNKYLTYVSWKEVSEKLTPNTESLLLGIGKNLMGQIEIIKLEETPHLLVAGSTGGGKSICLLALISSLIFTKTPQKLKLLLIDPKRVELGIFKNIPHLIGPVITESKLAHIALNKILNEIEKRYKLLEKQQTTNIINYNKLVDEKDQLPFIVIVVDELADLILTNRKEIETKIVRIGQIARAVGIFMILATQRPSSDIITSLIKTNIPGRIAFNVTNHNDSRTIINVSGAEKLLGKGDLLLKIPGQQTKRVQGVWIGTNDVQKLTNFWKKNNEKNSYWEEFKNLEIEHKKNMKSKFNDLSENDQDLYQEIKIFLNDVEEVSISLIQRKFNLGFNRAARLFEKLEKEEIISKNKEKKSRKIFHDKLKLD